MPAPSGAARYVHWRDERNHKLLWERSGISLFSGTLGPHDATDYHAHHHDTLCIILASAIAENDALVSPHYDAAAPATTTANFVHGRCLPYHGTDATYVHRVRSGAQPLAFLGIESARPRPPAATAPQLTAPSARLLEPEHFGFAHATRVALGPGETVAVPAAAAPPPAARLLVLTAGPPLAKVALRAPGAAVDRVPDRVEHGVRVGGVVALSPLPRESDGDCDDDGARLLCEITNLSEDQALDALVCDVF